MKEKIFLALSLCMMTFVMVSCGDDEPTLKPRLVLKLYNHKASELCMNKVYTTIDTGYYELDNLQDRMQLQRLAHAGVIEYTVQRYAWYNQCTDVKNCITKIIDYYDTCSNEIIEQRDVWGVDTTIEYGYEEHFMVSVHLKRKYMKMVVDELPVPYDKDLAIPQYKSWPEDDLQNNENWAPVAKPVLRYKHEKHLVGETCNRKRRGVQEIEQPETDRKTPLPYCFALDKKQEQAYRDAVSRVAKGKVYILGYEEKAVKVRNINIALNKDSITYGATCEVILHTTNVTPQGHILLNNIIDKIPTAVTVNLTYSDKKGWVIDASTPYVNDKYDNIEVKKIMNNKAYKVGLSQSPRGVNSTDNALVFFDVPVIASEYAEQVKPVEEENVSHVPEVVEDGNVEEDLDVYSGSRAPMEIIARESKRMQKRINQIEEQLEKDIEEMEEEIGERSTLVVPYVVSPYETRVPEF